MMSVLRGTLYTIPFSHYCEKVRWALAYFGVPYEEKRYLPIFHMPPVLLATKGAGKADRSSSPLSTPVWKDANGLICDSSLIVSYLSAQCCDTHVSLYPTEEVREWEDLFSRVLGPATRMAAYYHLLPERTLMLQMAQKNVGRLQGSMFWVVFGVWRRLLRKALRITPKQYAKHTERLEEVMTKVESQLADGRLYLVGDQLTAADITFAALSTPILGVQAEDGFGAWHPSFADMPEAFRSLVTAFQERPAGQYALRLFREHRQTPR